MSDPIKRSLISNDFSDIRTKEETFFRWYASVTTEWIFQHEAPLPDNDPKVADLIGHLAVQGYTPDAAVACLENYLFQH